MRVLLRFLRTRTQDFLAAAHEHAGGFDVLSPPPHRLGMPPTLRLVKAVEDLAAEEVRPWCLEERLHDLWASAQRIPVSARDERIVKRHADALELAQRRLQVICA